MRALTKQKARALDVLETTFIDVTPDSHANI
jgi:hypothetical protein